MLSKWACGVRSEARDDGGVGSTGRARSICGRVGLRMLVVDRGVDYLNNFGWVRRGFGVVQGAIQDATRLVVFAKMSSRSSNPSI